MDFTDKELKHIEDALILHKRLYLNTFITKKETRKDKKKVAALTELIAKIEDARSCGVINHTRA